MILNQKFTLVKRYFINQKNPFSQLKSVVSVKNNKINLIIDLDETLIHSSTEKLNDGAHIINV